MSIERKDRLTEGAQSLSRRTLHGAVWSLASQAALALGALITFVAMSRTVEHGELGEYMLAIVGVAAVQWLALNAYREPVIQATTLSSAICSSVFWFSSAVAALLAAALLTAAYYLHEHGQWMIAASCLSVLAVKVFFDTCSSVPLALCYRDLRFPVIARLNILLAAVGLIVSIALLRTGWGVLAVAVAQSVISALSFVMIMARCRWLPQWHFSRQDLGVLRHYSPHVVLWQGIEVLNMHFDRFLVGIKLSPQLLGIYGFGRRLNDVVIEVVVGALGNVALPTYASVRQDRAALKRAYLASIRIATFVVFPMIGILYGVADELVIAVFGSKWAPAVPIYKCFLMLGAIQTIGIFQAALIRSLGHANLWARYQVAQAAANIVVLGIAIEHGIYVLAVAVVIRTCIIWIYAVTMACRLAGIRVLDYLGMFVMPALCAVLAGVIAQGVMHLTRDVQPVAMIAGAAVIASLAYLGAALITMKSVTSDIRALIWRRS